MKKCLVCRKETKPIRYRIGKRSLTTENYCSKKCMGKYKSDKKGTIKTVFNGDGRWAANLPVDGHEIMGGIMMSNDDVPIQIIYKYNSNKHKYLPYTTWGDSIVYNNKVNKYTIKKR